MKSSNMILASFALIGTSLPCFAHEEPKELEVWYQALMTTDRAVIADLLADDVMFDLQDLGISQNRDEYIDSLDSWEDAIEGGSINFKFDWMESHDLDKAVALVCYHFESGPMIAKEIFTIVNGKFTQSIQSALDTATAKSLNFECAD